MKNFIKILLGLVVLTLISGVILLNRINTEENKQAMASFVRDATGYRLTIGGDLSLDFLPSFGLSLADVRLQNPDHPQELASASRIRLRVNLMPLLGRRLEVREISVADLHINYFVDVDGNSSWDNRQTAVPDVPAPPANTDDDTSGGLDLGIEHIRIANASMDMQNLATGSRYRLDRLGLESHNANTNGEPFSVTLDFDYENNGMSEPIPVVVAADFSLDLAAGTADITGIRASISPMLVTGEVAVANLSQSPAYSGSLNADRFDLPDWLNAMGLLSAPENHGAAASLTTARQLAFTLQFNGNAEQLEVDPLVVQVAGTNIKAAARLRMASDWAPLNLSYDVRAGKLDLSAFFPQSGATGEVIQPLQESTPALETGLIVPPRTDAELPVEWINSVNLLGTVTLESLSVNDILVEDISVHTHIEDGLMDIEVAPFGVFRGNVQAALRLHAGTTPPRFEATALTHNINLVALLPWLSRLPTVNGFLQSESRYSADGNTIRALLDTVQGNTAFTVAENSVDIGLIKQVFTAIAALGPTSEAIQQWPDAIRFGEMNGYHLLHNGLGQDQELKLRMDNLDISGRGGIDLEAGVFDYDLLFTVLGEPHTQTIPINELYHDIPWPVDCSAAFSDSVDRYCRPDFARVREIFTRIGTDAARRRLQEVITDQVPDELQDSARNLLRSLFN